MINFKFLQKTTSVIILGFLSGVLMLYRLGATALVNWDEAWFAAVAQSGGMWNGEVWFYEPPFLTWVLRLVMRIFGESEFWMRLVSHLTKI